MTKPVLRISVEMVKEHIKGTDLASLKLPHFYAVNST